MVFQNLMKKIECIKKLLFNCITEVKTCKIKVYNNDTFKKFIDIYVNAELKKIRNYSINTNRIHVSHNINIEDFKQNVLQNHNEIFEYMKCRLPNCKSKICEAHDLKDIPIQMYLSKYKINEVDIHKSIVIFATDADEDNTQTTTKPNELKERTIIGIVSNSKQIFNVFKPFVDN